MISGHNNAQFDPTRAPPGDATLTSWHLVPFELRGTTWCDVKEQTAEETHEIYSQYFSNLTPSNIVGRDFETPLDMLWYSPTFQRGDVSGLGTNFYR